MYNNSLISTWIDNEACKPHFKLGFVFIFFSLIFRHFPFLPMFHFKCKFTFDTKESASIRDAIEHILIFNDETTKNKMRNKKNHKKGSFFRYGIAKANIFYDTTKETITSDNVSNCTLQRQQTHIPSFVDWNENTDTQREREMERQKNCTTQGSNQRIELNNQPRITFKITKNHFARERKKSRRERWEGGGGQRRHFELNNSMQRVKRKWETK